ncbi:MAG: TauD/TfdA family dioxygenase [Sphingopyxis sp.]|uniref:TauD/TfdA dioxygenase family protein n=1 Tax=Sphingopyxis sp. TaxID=1908224 RepID=UPI003D81201F
MPFEIVPRQRGFGAHVRTDDPARLLTDDAGERLRDALGRHGVLIIPGLAIDDGTQVALARQFGEVQPFGDKAIFRSANFKHDGAFLPPDSDRARLLRLNWLWHSDGVYRDRDIGAVLLRAECVEPGCGETEFADLAAAFAALPESLQRRIEPLSVEFSFAHMVRNADVPSLAPGEMSHLPRARHPLVQRLADGRSSLRLSPPYMEVVVGWKHGESAQLFAELAEFATRPEFCFRHHWVAGDLIVWNNLSTIHRVLPYDDAGRRRDMRGAVVLV